MNDVHLDDIHGQLISFDPNGNVVDEFDFDHDWIIVDYKADSKLYVMLIYNGEIHEVTYDVVTRELEDVVVSP